MLFLCTYIIVSMVYLPQKQLPRTQDFVNNFNSNTEKKYSQLTIVKSHPLYYALFGLILLQSISFCFDLSFFKIISRYDKYLWHRGAWAEYCVLLIISPGTDTRVTNENKNGRKRLRRENRVAMRL